MSDNAAGRFSEILKATRTGAKLSQTELAEKAGLTPAAISQIEAGERLPAFATLVQLSKALQTSVGYLLGEDSASAPPDMKAMFRDLKELGPEDRDKVKDFAAFLRAQVRHKDK